tara:strand:+ start:489 stop:752 length:264 start_codon:yes stop_codon:yes gene_type:complete
LVQSEKARDDDRYIDAVIWNKEAEKLGLTSIKEFINAYYKGKITDPNAISRVRRKLQELYPELKGEKYAQRQEEYQANAKEKIKSID